MRPVHGVPLLLPVLLLAACRAPDPVSTFGVHASAVGSATIDAVTPQPASETASVSVTVSAPGDGVAPFEIRWVWGDGAVTQVAGTASTAVASHAYADDGTYSFAAEITDQAAVVSTATAMILVDNVPPSFGAVADRTVTEGALLLLELPASDPAGANDPLTFTLVNGPAGMAVTPGGTLGWVPAYSQSGGGAGAAHSIDVEVSDGDGGAATLTFTVRAQWKDDDADGMADTWETGHGMDPTIDDSLGDADGDGILNINEFNGTGPFTPNGVTPLSPLTAEEVNVEDPVLVVQNTTDADSGALTYVFQLFSDASLSTLVHQGSAVEGTAGTTSFTLDDTLTDAGADGDDPANAEDVDLADDTDYWWRTRAFDGTYSGPWSPVQRFRYDPANDPPGFPSADSPVALSSVPTLSPVLVAGNPGPDDDPPGPLTFHVYDSDPTEFANEIRTSLPVEPGLGGTTSWIVMPPLPTDDVTYYWRATVTDARGATAVGPPSLFRVNLGNDPPGVPTLLAPQDGASVESAAPSFSATGATDPDGDAVSYRFEVDVTPSFNSPAKQSGIGELCGLDGADSCYTPATPLVENQLYWWRVRVFDSSAYGEPAIGTFRVDQVNDAPGVPVPLSPSGALVITTQPAFVALVATDPEAEALTYDFQVLDEDGAIAVAQEGVAPDGESVTWTPSTGLEKGGRYTWQVRAVDERALAGAFSTAASFEVYRKPSRGGGGCSVAMRASPLGGLLALAGIALAIRRRQASAS